MAPHHTGGRAIGFRFGPRQSLAGWTNEVATTACLPDCWLHCDEDCEAGPRHCWNLHRPSHKPDWHDQHAWCLGVDVMQVLYNHVREVAQAVCGTTQGLPDVINEHVVQGR